ncbi:cell division protein ZapA [Anaerolentibacter hominis]|uniref:cell division protein ZapA n=1 Tax=Anaerolentibacter hominis TaxID=3079009 RepID=UPI0031B89F53
MKTRNDAVVTINNKEYVIGGYESGDYLQKVAAYINRKHEEFREQPFYGRLNPDMKNVLLEINIADDYFKATEQVRELEEYRREDSKEIFELKHQLMELEARLKKTEAELMGLKNTERN